MTITIKLNTGNAAFESDPGIEVIRIVRQTVIPLIESGERGTNGLYDYNGNKVGTVTIAGK